MAAGAFSPHSHTLLAALPALALDLETTGLVPGRDRIVQAVQACVRMLGSRPPGSTDQIALASSASRTPA